jgi:hypothetical protein
MTTIIDNVDGFSLEKNLAAHLAVLKRVPHARAAQQEAEKLRPLFGAMAEYVQGYPAEFLRKQKTCVMGSFDYNLLNHFQSKQRIDIDADQIERAFLGLAQKYGSLILSDMPLTTLHKVQSYAYIYNKADEGKIDGQSTTAAPSYDAVSCFGGWGFVQLYRPEDRTRITLPTLGLTNTINFDEMRIDSAALIRLTELVGRICNHDWLHHMTMTSVSNNVGYTAGVDGFKKNVNGLLDKLPFFLGEERSSYEAFCTQTHARLLKTESARSLWHSLEAAVQELTEGLNDNFMHLRQVSGNKLQDYKALHNIAITTARILRRVEPIESPMMQAFIKNVVNAEISNDPMLSKARNQVWKTSALSFRSYAEQASTKLVKKANKTGLYTGIFESSEFTRSNRDGVAELAACLQMGFPKQR